MKDTIFQLPTKLYFGRDNLKYLAREIKKYSNRILLTYGMNSIKKIGLYDEVVNILKENDIYFVELGGIKPNPEVSTIRKGVELINKHNLTFILAVGGGSVLDNSKHMAISQAANKDIWYLAEHYQEINKVSGLIKIGSIMTISATGSEMNNGGVLTNPETNDKVGIGHREAYPVFSFLNPDFLITLPQHQRVAGVCDTFSHLLEWYFSSHQDEGFADRYIEALMINVLKYAKTYINNNEDYEANSQIMISATFALNGISAIGKKAGDWNTHALEHQLSALTDFTHGTGLALIHPQVLNTYLNKDIDENKSLVKFINIGKNVFHLDIKDDTELAIKTCLKIKETFDYWLDNKNKLSDYQVVFNYDNCVNKLVDDGYLTGEYQDLTKNDISKIYEEIA
ncbi:MAG: iron-containing alcohol dehydrogenase [Bacilli bacterium]|jgi:alcohol dehydrogenase YqhD (iron-dependent ADH family)|nr:iron-containing alcohol dehydrogenase [Bacilli bacterium]